MSNSTMSADAQSGSDDGQTATLAVGGLVVVLAVVTVILRFYVRILTRVGLWWDDWLILGAVIIGLLDAALLIWASAIDPNGAAAATDADPSHVYTPEDVLYNKLSFISPVLYLAISGASKLGILLMYQRIFYSDRFFRFQLVIASSLAIGWWLGCTIASLASCIPMEYTWINALEDPRYCFNFNIFWMASGACEVLIDVIILVLPVRVILSLHLSRQKKATIACIFLLGGLVVITGLIKTIEGYVPGSRNPSFARTEIWTVVHVSMGMVCASLPIFRPLVTQIAKSKFAAKLVNSRSHYRMRSLTRSSEVDRSRKARGRPGRRLMENAEFSSETELRRLFS